MRKLTLAIGLTLLLAVVMLASDWYNRKAAPPPATQKRLAIAQFAPEEGSAAAERGLLAALAEQGWREGDNLMVTRKDVNAIMSAIPPLLQSLDSERYDVLVTFTTPMLNAACRAVQHTPMVFAYVTDGIAAGAGRTDTDHLPHLTGVSSFDPVPETLDLLQRLLPRARRVGLLYNAADIAAMRVLTAAEQECTRRGLVPVTLAVASTNEVQQAAQGLVARGIDVQWFFTDNTVIQAAPAVMETMRRADIPVIVNEPSLSDGSIACVGVGWEGVGRRAGLLAARILAGESPSAIPLQRYVSVSVALHAAHLARFGIAADTGA